MADTGSWELPGHLQHLPEVTAAEFPAWSQPVFLECFAGKAVLTTAALSLGLPCAKPWNLQSGKVSKFLERGNDLFRAVKDGRIRHIHFGAPCQSMTWARSPQLRSTDWPLGLPGLTDKQRVLVQTGNELACFTASLCIHLWSVGATFSVENPGLSWMWLLPCFRQVRDLPGVFCAC